MVDEFIVISGHMQVVTGVIGRVMDITDKEAVISLMGGPVSEPDDPYLRVKIENYGKKNWPPREGDIVTTTVPTVVKVKRL